MKKKFATVKSWIFRCGWSFKEFSNCILKQRLRPEFLRKFHQTVKVSSISLLGVVKADITALNLDIPRVPQQITQLYETRLPSFYLYKTLNIYVKTPKRRGKIRTFCIFGWIKSDVPNEFPISLRPIDIFPRSQRCAHKQRTPIATRARLYFDQRKEEKYL